MNPLLLRLTHGREFVDLANAFHLQDVPYRWERGICEPLPRLQGTTMGAVA